MLWQKPFSVAPTEASSLGATVAELHPTPKGNKGSKTQICVSCSVHTLSLLVFLLVGLFFDDHLKTYVLSRKIYPQQCLPILLPKSILTPGV